MSKKVARVGALLAASLVLVACAEGPFDEYAAVLKLQAQPIQLDGEQLVLTDVQIACGERDDLWVVIPQGPQQSTARLTDRGRALGFSDDIHIGDPEIHYPFAQIRGKFTVSASEPHLRDVDENTKLLEARVGVNLNHDCLSRPLPVLMGMRRGRFSTTDNPQFQFRMHSDQTWTYRELIH